MKQISKLDFSLNNIPRKYIAFGQIIILIARKLNEVIAVLNEMNKDKP